MLYKARVLAVLKRVASVSTMPRGDVTELLECNLCDSLDACGCLQLPGGDASASSAIRSSAAST
jgi:hypothetical protein